MEVKPSTPSLTATATPSQSTPVTTSTTHHHNQTPHHSHHKHHHNQQPIKREQLDCEQSLNESIIEIKSELRKTESDVIRELKAQLKKSLEAQRDMKLLLDMFKSADKEKRFVFINNY